MNDSVSRALKTEIDDLVELGKRLAKNAATRGNYPGADEVALTSTWVARIGQVIRKLYPADNQHQMNYETTLKEKDFYRNHSNHYAHIGVIAGIIAAVQHEFDKGLLFDVKQLIRADIFADFLEMAEYLLAENYKDAAAVIIGSVLEDSLRKLANVNHISTLTAKGTMLTLEPLNVELAKANVYDKLIQKQITSWGDLRNKAAHGRYNEYDKTQVEMMLLFVQKFCSDYLK